MGTSSVRWLCHLWIIFIFCPQITPPAFADCRAKLLATSLSSEGALTVIVDSGGTVHLVNDGFQTEGFERIPKFSRSALSTKPLTRVPTSLMAAAPKRNTPFVSYLEAGGNFGLITDSAHPHFLLLPNKICGHSIALVEWPIEEWPAGFHSFNSLRTDEEPAGGSHTASSSETHAYAKKLPLSLYVGAGTELYASRLIPFPIPPENPIAEHIARGGVYRKVQTAFDGEILETSDPFIFDFELVKGTTGLVMGTQEPGWALELTPFQRVASLNPSDLISSINFLYPIGRNQLILGSETGTVVVYDLNTHQVTARPSFTNIVWLQSLAATRIGDRIEIFVVDAVSRKVLSWNSETSNFGFTAEPIQFPTGVTPIQVSAQAQLAPMGYTPSKTNSTTEEGFLSNVKVVGKKVYIERVVVLGSDGKMYARVDDTSLVINSASTKWISSP